MSRPPLGTKAKNIAVTVKVTATEHRALRKLDLDTTRPSAGRGLRLLIDRFLGAK